MRERTVGTEHAQCLTKTSLGYEILRKVDRVTALLIKTFIHSNEIDVF